MDAQLKKVLIIITAIISILLIANIVGVNYGLNRVKNNLQESQNKIDEAVKSINNSKIKIDSIQSDLSNFKLYISDVQSRVEVMDLERRIREQTTKHITDSLKKRLQDLKHELNTETMELPDITTVTIENNNK